MKKQPNAKGGSNPALSSAQPEPEPLEPITDSPKSLTEQRDKLSAQLVDVQQKIHALSVTERELSESITKLDARIEKETPQPNTAQLIQAYQQSQQQLKREAPSGTSPLDEAMARKRGRGRPEFPVVS